MTTKNYGYNAGFIRRFCLGCSFEAHELFAFALATTKEWHPCRSYLLLAASKHAESFRAREKRYSFCAGCPVAIGELERRHNTDTEVIDRAGRLPGKQDSVRGSNKRLPHHAFKEAPACVAP